MGNCNQKSKIEILSGSDAHVLLRDGNCGDLVDGLRMFGGVALGSRSFGRNRFGLSRYYSRQVFSGITLLLNDQKGFFRVNLIIAQPNQVFFRVNLLIAQPRSFNPLSHEFFIRILPLHPH